MNLDRLEKVAREATPGPWEVTPGSAHVYATDDDGYCDLAQCDESEDATHIATFDPPTVLALLRVVRAAGELERAAGEHGNEHGVSGDLGARLYDIRAALSALDEAVR